MKQSKAHIKCIASVFLSSILLSLSFSSFNLSFLAWIGLVPLFFALKDKSPKQSFILSYICGFLFFLFSMYWLIHVTVFGWLVLSLYQALYFGIFGLAFVIASESDVGGRARQSKEKTIYYMPYTIYFFIPITWCLLEYIRANLFGGIGWNLLAYSQYEQLPIIQIADITGAYGVSFLIVLANLAIFSILPVLNSKVKTEAKVKIVLRILVVSIIFILALFYGYNRITGFSFKDIKSRRLQLSLVQGNIAQTHKWDTKYKDYILDKYENLTLRTAKDKADIIIWPETSMPGYLNKESRLIRYMEGLSKKASLPILAGTPMFSVNDEGQDFELNSAVLFSKKGHIIQRYDKLHLVMLGEYIPFEKYFPGIRNFFPITGKFVPGKDYTIFKLTTYPSASISGPLTEGSRTKVRGNLQLTTAFGTLICFEDIFPGMVRQFVKKGADFMVNITNDAWFGKSAAPYQHAANSVFRAVENRRAFARSANTGLTCFIDRIGKLKPKEIFVDGHITDSIVLPQDTTLTFYTKYGDVFILFCLFVLGCFLIDYMRYRKYNN